LRWRAVCVARGRSRSKLYADIKSGLFPPPVQLGLRAVGWPETDILAEQQARIAERDGLIAKRAARAERNAGAAAAPDAG
jgi:prophage regulatory protein